uniref:Exportin-2 n=1 Tax=Ditylenchus dipsaci TaxID=166011 RepID=A0A915DYI5_9BILA
MSIAANPQIAQLLQGTLSVDNQTRKNAEAQLKRLCEISGVAVAFLHLIRSEQVSPEIRMAASLVLKNFVRENWQCPLLEDEREELRKAILESLFELPTIYRRQMSATVCLIGKYDFPEKWPRLIEVIGECLTSAADFDKLVTALSTLEELVKRYRHEMKSNKLWTEINFVLKAVAEPLTQLYSKMLLYMPAENAADTMSTRDRLSWLDIVLLSLKIYHSLVSQDLPEYFEDNLTSWMNGNLQLLKMKLPSIEEIADDSEANALDKLKCVICEITTLFSQRYEDCFGDYTQSFIEVIWQLLVEIDSRIRYDSLVNAALGFLSAISQPICENVIIKNLSLRNEDVEMYQSEPFDFLKRDIEGSDAETRRRGATDFVRALCKQFEQQIFPILSRAIGTFLNEYQQNPDQNFVKKDVVYYLVTAMASKATTARYGATSTSQLINVSDFYEQYVRGDLLDGDANHIPILRTDALKYLCFCGKNNQQANSIIRLLSSEHILLHHYVGYAVERLLLMKTSDGQSMLTSNNIPVRALIDALFDCFNRSTAYSTHYIMKALMRCFNIIDPATASIAHIYVGRLEQMVIQAIRNPINTQLVHFVFESLCVLIRKAYTKVEGGLDKHVIRIIELIIPKDVVDLVPYALQVTALLLDQSQAELLSLFVERRLLVAISQHPCPNAGLRVLITSFPQVVFGAEYVDQVLGCFQRLISSKAYDQHGFRLANAFLNHIDVNEKMTIEDSQVQPPVGPILVPFAIVKGGAALANALESIQQGIFLMVMEKIMVAELKTMRQVHTYEEKRIITIGVAAIIKDTVNVLGQHYGALKNVEWWRRECKPTRSGCQLDDQYAEMNEIEYSDPYCKLSYAQHPDGVGKQVSNIKAYLAEAVLVHAYQANLKVWTV